MYQNHLQELAQRSCFNLPAYACIREGPDHAPRFKATVIFNGELFESPNYCSTLRQAEHAAAEVALNILSRRSSSQSLATRFFGSAKTCCRNSSKSWSVITDITTQSGPGHLPVFTCSVEVAGMTSSGEAARTKKQAEKNAAMAAWSALKQFVNWTITPPLEADLSEEHEQNTIAWALANAHGKEGSVAKMQQLPSQPAIGSIPPTRIRSVPTRETGKNCVVTVRQLYSRSRLADLSSGQLILCNQPHASVVNRTAPGYQLVGSMPGANSSVNLWDVSSLSMELFKKALVARRTAAAAGSMANLGQAPVHVWNLIVHKDRHEVAPPLSEHQHDQDEWLQEESSKATTEMDNRSGISEADHGSSVFPGSYNPISWACILHLCQGYLQV